MMLITFWIKSFAIRKGKGESVKLSILMKLKIGPFEGGHKEKAHSLFQGLSIRLKFKFLLARLFRKLIYEVEKDDHFDELYNFYLKIRLQKGQISSDGSYYYVFLNSSRFLLRKESSDIAVFNQVILIEEYVTVVDIIRLNNITVRTVIDAGANIGLTSLFFCNYFFDATILCIEPDYDNFRMLQKNIQSSGNKNMIEIHGGISPIDGILSLDERFREGRDWSKAFTLKTESDTGGIPGFSIKTLMNQHNIFAIDLLKIDIEGGERFLFGNDPVVYDFLGFVKVIAIEIHDEFNCRQLIYDILIENGFLIFNTGELTIGINKNFVLK